MKTANIKTPSQLWSLGAAVALSLAFSSEAAAQVLPSDYYTSTNPLARRPGSAAAIVVATDALTNAPFAANGTSTGTGTVGWNLSAEGFTQAKVLVLDVQLAARTQLTGSSLVFGREISTEILGIGGGALINSTVNSLLGLNVLAAWDATSTINSLSLSTANTYTLSFDINSGAGLGVGALSAASFQLSGTDSLGNVYNLSNGSSGLVLNLLDLITVGTQADSGLGQFVFETPVDLVSLSLSYSATATADVSLLGTTPGNQEVLSFSNIQLSATPVPEPGSAVLFGIAGMLLIMRQRRR